MGGSLLCCFLCPTTRGSQTFVCLPRKSHTTTAYSAFLPVSGREANELVERIKQVHTWYKLQKSQIIGNLYKCSPLLQLLSLSLSDCEVFVPSKASIWTAWSRSVRLFQGVLESLGGGAELEELAHRMSSSWASLPSSHDMKKFCNTLLLLWWLTKNTRLSASAWRETSKNVSEMHHPTLRLDQSHHLCNATITIKTSVLKFKTAAKVPSAMFWSCPMKLILNFTHCCDRMKRYCPKRWVCCEVLGRINATIPRVDSLFQQWISYLESELVTVN